MHIILEYGTKVKNSKGEMSSNHFCSVGFSSFLAKTPSLGPIFKRNCLT